MSTTISAFKTVKEVAEILKVSTHTVLNLIKRGSFPNALKTSPAPNGHWRISETDLQQYMNRQSINLWLPEETS